MVSKQLLAQVSPKEMTMYVELKIFQFYYFEIQGFDNYFRSFCIQLA